MRSLCKRLDLPEEVASRMVSLHQELPAFDLQRLRQEDSWETALTELHQQLTPDPNGFKMLCCMLRCVLLAWEDYQKLDIPEEIFLDTYRCFTRFVQEHRESYGIFGFDRAFWTVRQVSLKLFRVGQLEYELMSRQGQKMISIHIPSDACLSPPLLRQSWEDARAVIRRTAPEWRDAAMFCKSWLLSPDLQEVLPGSSRILLFQRSFAITPIPSSKGYVQWVYKNPKLTPSEYPEKTTLQRNLKAWLLQGGEFRDGHGILTDSPFL